MPGETRFAGRLVSREGHTADDIQRAMEEVRALMTQTEDGGDLGGGRVRGRCSLFAPRERARGGQHALRQRVEQQCGKRWRTSFH